MYPLIVSAIVPRPIALLSSISTEVRGDRPCKLVNSIGAHKNGIAKHVLRLQGIVNLAPYSFFNVMCFDPVITQLKSSCMPWTQTP